MEAHICKCCGGSLTKKDNFYVCPYCRATYEDDAEERAAVSLKGLLDEEKIEKLSNARRVLWDLVHRKNASNKKVLAATHEVLFLYPDDVLARFYEASIDDDPAILNSMLLNASVDEPIADEIMRWVLTDMNSRNVTALKTFAERHFSDEKRREYWTKIEDEAHKLDEGLYETSVPRDVFLAYSSADQDRVAQMADFLESEGFTVFVAYRNLRHGKGAVERYEAALYDAMKHCRVLVFLSSNSSRNLQCDAIKKELPYIADNLHTMGRIEYILEEPTSTPTSVKLILKRVFEGLEWCRDREDLVGRILRYTAATSHVCASCGHVNLPEARFCLKCGSPLDEEAANLVREREQRQAAEREAEERARIEAEREAARLAAEAEAARAAAERAQHAEAEGVTCPNCGTKNSARAKFCSGCGQSLTGGSRSKPKPVRHDEEPEPEPEPKPVRPSSGAEFDIDGGVLVKYNGSSSSVTVPSSVKEIGEEAFADNDDVKDIYIPSSVKKIGKEAFRGIHAKLHFEQDEDSFYPMAKGWGNTWKFKFHGLMLFGEKVEHVDAPATGIGSRAKPKPKPTPVHDEPAPSQGDATVSSGDFEIKGGVLVKYHGSASEVTIPDSVKEIGEEAFADQDGVKKLYIPTTVKKIGREAFRETHIELHFEQDEDSFYPMAKAWGHTWKYKFSGLMLFGEKFKHVSGGGSTATTSTTSVTTETKPKPKKKPTPTTDSSSSGSSSGDFEIKGGVLVKYHGSDTDVTIPDSVKEIAEEAFADQDGIKHLYIPATVKKIGREAFRETHIELHFEQDEDSFYPMAKAWGHTWKYKFSGLMLFGEKFKHVSGPATATASTSGGSARTATSSASVAPTPKGKARVYASTHNGRSVMMDATYEGDFVISDGVLKRYRGSASTIVIPATVTEIAEGAFRFSELTEISVPDTVTKIGPSAFRGCPNLVKVNLPPNLEKIEEFSFNNCPKLKFISIPDTVTEIGDWAFRGCTALAKIEMSSAVTKIGNWAFSGIEALKILPLPGTVTEIGDHAFAGSTFDVTFDMTKSVYIARCADFNERWDDDHKGVIKF